jgi:hypothetical protein
MTPPPIKHKALLNVDLGEAVRLVHASICLTKFRNSMGTSNVAQMKNYSLSSTMQTLRVDFMLAIQW